MKRLKRQLKVVVKKKDGRKAKGYFSDNCLLHTAIRRKYPQAIFDIKKGVVEVNCVKYVLDYSSVIGKYEYDDKTLKPFEKFTVYLEKAKYV